MPNLLRAHARSIALGLGTVWMAGSIAYSVFLSWNSDPIPHFVAHGLPPEKLVENSICEGLPDEPSKPQWDKMNSTEAFQWMQNYNTETQLRYQCRTQRSIMELEFAPVSGWYGPGSWFAFLTTVISGTGTLLTAIFSKRYRRKPSPDVIAAVVYSLTSCWDLYQIDASISWDTNALSLLPRLVAAKRASAFSGAVLEVYSLLLAVHLWKQPTQPVHTGPYLDFLLTWPASFVHLFVLRVMRNRNGYTPFKEYWWWDYFTCVEDIAENYVYWPRSAPAVWFGSYTVGWELKLLALAPAVIFIVGSILVFRAGFWHRVRQHLPSVIGIPLMSGAALVLSLYITWGDDLFHLLRPNHEITPSEQAIVLAWAIIRGQGWLFVFIFLVLVAYPVYCTISFGVVFVLAAIPGSGAFPYSGISLWELDQIGSFCIVLVYQTVRIISGSISLVLEQRDNTREQRLVEGQESESEPTEQRVGPV
ncbi:hypothetical protein DL96DRAFT_1676467 [Flagelloscypha sp. PMI_526]|nr:hypothetical protein DL96DRAFT_1676467 [Flagelloscypha sp. PMI_526]